MKLLRDATSEKLCSFREDFPAENARIRDGAEIPRFDRKIS